MASLHRDLDTADRRHHRRSALVLVADHAAHDGFHVKRIAAQDPAFDPLVRERHDRLFLPLQRRLADARQTVVGAQEDEQIIPQAGISQEGFEGDDLQLNGSSTPCSIGPRACRMIRGPVFFKRLAAPDSLSESLRHDAMPVLFRRATTGPVRRMSLSIA
jgi:hypothetical protein